jgi:hypothetical protein
MIMKTVLVTGSIAFVVVLCVTLLTLFGPTTVASQYVKFAIMLLMFVVILVGSYWFVMVPSGTNGRSEDPSGRDSEGGAHREA